ncbi:hypothetical protein FSP39_020099 [Pinctada imbricata]|uniref:CR-type domain-containing protein n=1 Tax=Pinctada imbricata TaxID=66713 RepID=A0AA89BXQ6_PINIB|nr:hypothetical protein FSP39_020099 [Pinctada imbricata]
MGGGMGGRRGRRRGEDTHHPLRVSLEDLYNGKTSKLQLSKTVICSKCKGAGGKQGAMQKCKACNGRGVKVTLRQLGPGMVQQMQSICPECHGEGEIINEKDRCKDCRGKKVKNETKILEVHVDKGMKDNQKITFRGEGDQLPDVEPGDVIIILQQKEHELFTREGNDLYCSYNLSLTEALCGFQFTIKHLDGRDLLIKSPPGVVIHPGAIRTVKGEGMPMYRNPFEKGNLYVKFDISFPPTNFASEEDLKKLEKLLPKRPKVDIPEGEDVEEVDLVEYDDTRGGRGRREAYDEDDDEEGHGHGPRVQCAHQ